MGYYIKLKMKFALLIASVVAIKISDDELPHPQYSCEGIGEEHAPTSTAQCNPNSADTWSVQDWIEIRTLLNPGGEPAKCCYKVHHGHDENLGLKHANCDRNNGGPQ